MWYGEDSFWDQNLLSTAAGRTNQGLSVGGALVSSGPLSPQSQSSKKLVSFRPLWVYRAKRIGYRTEPRAGSTLVGKTADGESMTSLYEDHELPSSFGSGPRHPGDTESALTKLRKMKRMKGRLPENWKALAERAEKLGPKNEHRTVVIGAGIGGLTAAALLARHGFPVTVLERHNKPGGYATNFHRKGFTFEVSLHTVSVSGTPTATILRGLDLFDRVKFNALPEYHRLVAPGRDVTYPFADMEGYKKMLADIFPSEQRAIDALVDEITGVSDDVLKLDTNAGQFVPYFFPYHFKKMYRNREVTLQQLLERSTSNRELQTMLGLVWQYYGLPPSKLSGFFYCAGTGDYIKKGGFYPEGSSQAISDALTAYIEERGGTVKVKTSARRIVLRKGRAVGVEDSAGNFYEADTVVSNASPPVTFWKLLDPDQLPGQYLDKLETYAPSDSSFTVWLGLDQDVCQEHEEAEVFLLETTDTDLDYAACLDSDAEHAGLVVNFYNNMASDFAPEGKSGMSITFLCGYRHWLQYEADYFAKRKDAYRAEKKRIASIMIDRVEKNLVPGLRKMIEVQEIGTPLTNRRYTGNPGGAIYGYAMSPDNAFLTRIDNRTPIPNLYLASAWGTPGGGFTGCFRGAQQTWRCIIEDWESSQR